MAMITSGQPATWFPDETGDLIIRPVTADSVAFTILSECGGLASTTQRVHNYRVPVWQSDPTAAWIPEGGEIPTSNGALAEETDGFYKLAGLVTVSRELANDSDPDAAQQVGNGLARDISRKIDAAFFGSRGQNLDQPRGLGDITGVGTINAGTEWADSDPFVSAVYAAEGVGATLAAFVANPADALALAKLKSAKDSNLPLLGADPTQPTRRVIAGVPLYSSAAVTTGTVWAIPANGLVLGVIREDVDVRRDESVKFTSDQVMVRATMRITTLFPHPAAIQKITLS